MPFGGKKNFGLYYGNPYFDLFLSSDLCIVDSNPTKDWTWELQGKKTPTRLLYYIINLL